MKNPIDDPSVCLACAGAPGAPHICEEGQKSEMVWVQRKDLEKAVDFMEQTAGIYWIEGAKRLRAALDAN